MNQKIYLNIINTKNYMQITSFLLQVCSGEASNPFWSSTGACQYRHDGHKSWQVSWCLRSDANLFGGQTKGSLLFVQQHYLLPGFHPSCQPRPPNKLSSSWWRWGVTGGTAWSGRTEATVVRCFRRLYETATRYSQSRSGPGFWQWLRLPA